MTQAHAHPTREIEIRYCSSVAEFVECVRIEHAIWGAATAVPTPVFVVAAHESGGQVLGAFQDDRMVGFALAFAALRDGQHFLHSHMAAVLPEFRDRGVGRSLKLAQRKDALARGIGLIEWTFDPLDLKNAYFNLVRLGVIARRFIPNCYGITGSKLHGELPTDRLVAEWWLDSDRVKAVLAGHAPAASGEAERIAIPAAFSALRESDRASAARIQSDARTQFLKWFGKGYAATGVAQRDDATDYLLEPEAAIKGLKLPKPKEN